MKPTIVSIPWYARADYTRMLAIAEDADNFHPTYDDWLAQAEAARKDLERKGLRVFRAEIKPDDFARWCMAEGKKLDAKARIAFANLLLMKKIRGEMQN